MRQIEQGMPQQPGLIDIQPTVNHIVNYLKIAGYLIGLRLPGTNQEKLYHDMVMNTMLNYVRKFGDHYPEINFISYSGVDGTHRLPIMTYNETGEELPWQYLTNWARGINAKVAKGVEVSQRDRDEADYILDSNTFLGAIESRLKSRSTSKNSPTR